MLNHAQAERNLRAIDDKYERYREWKIQRMQSSFQMDRDTAALSLEWLELKYANIIFAGFCGMVSGMFTYRKLNPILQARSLLFKKPWMVPVVPSFGFYCGYLGAKELRGRRFAGRDVTFESMSGSNDVISKFRELDQVEKNTARDKVLHYLQTSVPTSKSEINKRVSELAATEENPYLKNKRVKRIGKDRDDIYYLLGKIHGLENIAFLTDEELAEIDGNPIKLQEAINNVKVPETKATSFDALLSKAMKESVEYKKQVEKMDLYPSDKAKMLSLPFFMARRQQGVTPIKGQWQYDFFEEIFGKKWNAHDHNEYDPEDKPKIDDLPAGLRQRLDTEHPDFKKEFNKYSLLFKTEIERHQANQEWFKMFNIYLAHLNLEEGRALYHLLKNRKDEIQELHGGEAEAELAKIAEKESYAARNYNMLRKTKLQYLDKQKHPISKAKVKDLFLFSDEFKNKFFEEVGVYDNQPNVIETDKKLTRYFYNFAVGPWAYLRDEIGMKRDQLELQFLRGKEIQELLSDGKSHLVNQLKVPVNVEDYETKVNFSMADHHPDVTSWRLGRTHESGTIMDYPKYEMEDMPAPNYYQSTLNEELFAPVEDDDDEEGEGGDDEVQEFKEPYFELTEEEEEMYEEPEWPYTKPKWSLQKPQTSEIFDYNEEIFEKYTKVEIESFMKLLDIQPFRNWDDKAGYHQQFGRHYINDPGQRTDAEYYMAGEIEREMFEKMVFTQHRSGAIVRFAIGDKKPKFASSD